MTQGIVLQGFVPVSLQPQTKMISQILFGETFQILETWKNWSRIVIEANRTEGWVDTAAISTTDPMQDPTTFSALAIQPFNRIRDRKTGKRILAPAGAVWGTHPDKPLRIGDRKLELDVPEDWAVPGKACDPEIIGQNLLSVPYLEGGRCGMGTDGPGLVQLVCRCMGLNLPHHAGKQSETGRPLSFIEEIRKGDLVFFDNEEGEIIHSGMSLEEGRILHAAEQVRIDRLDHQGIYNTSLEKYTYRLRIIMRPDF